jgi:PAS domain
MRCGHLISKYKCRVMSSFRTFAEWRSIKELGLSSRAREITLDEARANPDFSYPLELHGLWLLMPGDIPHVHAAKASVFSTKILPSMFIVDVKNEGRDFSWRLLGTDHARRFGSEVTGRRMAAVAKFDNSAKISLVFARKCYATREPIFFKIEYLDQQHIKKATCTVALPLVDDNGEVKRLFGCSVWN